MFRIVPQLAVSDMLASIAYYTERFEFNVAEADPPDSPEFASLEREGTTLFLVSQASGEEQSLVRQLSRNKRGLGVRLFLEVDNAQTLYDRFVEGGVAIHRELAIDEAQDYSEFSILDPDGYEISIYS